MNRDYTQIRNNAFMHNSYSRRLRALFSLLCAALLGSSCVVAEEADDFSEQCPPAQGVALQVLGSGGPIADDGRASSSYLVWVDGKARVLVDAGGGSFLRFAEAGARFEDLDLIALSHFHADHSAGLPALLKSGNFSGRKSPLRISGPTPGGPFPGLSGFLGGLISPEQGAFRYLKGYLDGTANLALLDTVELPHQDSTVLQVYDSPGMKVTALAVPHGIVPAMAYRVEASGKTIVFGSDQNGSRPEFGGFAQGADVLVAHMAIPEDAGKVAKSLHATPSGIGKMATSASVSHLLLSHFMARSLQAMDENLELLGREFAGTTEMAEDLYCMVP